ncbi:MAG TPA: ATP-binding protein [Desulfomonilaceae bacterium]|nr:ATP-binding protein [Desulfomonilaceae bacterium]
MLDSFVVVTVLCLYMAFLFLIAIWVERRSGEGRPTVDNPFIYSLSLAVYCTGWTYYGSVGKAATSGFLFLPIYLGPTIAIVMWWTVLRKLIRIKTTHHITSIADFISARYNKSQAVAALATLIALVGTMPYIALQFKAVISTFAIITSGEDAPSWMAQHMGPVLVCLMCIFTIILGIRRLDPTERHPGMVMAVAVECLVKLVAFLAAGIFVTYFMFDGFGDIFRRLSESRPEIVLNLWKSEQSYAITWTTYLLLAMSAIMFLPRQFHISVVENYDENHIRTATWLFPLYMLLINVFVLPIAMGGLLQGYQAREADTFVLALPLQAGQTWLSLLVFLGGASAATGMIMISSITVTTMITNHLLLPVMGWVEGLGFLRRHLLKCRWVAVAGVILIGYWFERQVGESYMLVNIGMVAFAAAFQFAPAILGGIFWRRGNEAGALLGLGAGFVVWFYTLLLPAFVRSGWISDTLLTKGPWGIGFLNPEQLFGVTSLDSLTHSVFWSTCFNLGLYVLGSLSFQQSEEERSFAEDFVGSLVLTPSRGRSGHRESYIDLGTKRKSIVGLLSQYFTDTEAESMTEKCLEAVGIMDKNRISIIELAELHNEVEKCLAGSIGTAAAHKALKDGRIFTSSEARELSEIYAEILASLKVTPEELERKIDYYQEREALLTHHAADLEEKVQERTRDLKVAQEELIKSEKLAVLGQLTAIVSHELRNPLGVIRSSVYFLTRKFTEPDEKTRKHLDRIEHQVDLCDSIIGELLEYTRGRRSAVVKGEINPWLDDVLDQFNTSKQVMLTRELAPGLPSVHFDEEKMRRVIINLVENAVQAVSARESAGEEKDSYNGQVKVSTAPSSKGVLIHVVDNGLGMDKETARRAFEPLFTTRARGTGLGLAIVRKIVEEHGGTVAMRTALKHGTTVSVELPAADGDNVLQER